MAQHENRAPFARVGKLAGQLPVRRREGIDHLSDAFGDFLNHLCARIARQIERRDQGNAICARHVDAQHSRQCEDQPSDGFRQNRHGSLPTSLSPVGEDGSHTPKMKGRCLPGRKRAGWLLVEAAAGMLALVWLMLVFTTAMGDWAEAQRDASTSDRTFAMLQGVLAPAAWVDCVAPYRSSTSSLVPAVPQECDALASEDEVVRHTVFSVDYLDFYRLTPYAAGCDPDRTQAASVRSATVEAFRPEDPSEPLRRHSEEQRNLRAQRWAWTAVSRGTLGPGPLSADVWRQVPIPGLFGGTQLERLGVWRFPSDDTERAAGPPHESCNVIVVPVGYGVRYQEPGTTRTVSCVLALEGPNPPC